MTAMETGVAELTQEIKKNKGASSEVLRRLTVAIGTPPPDDYLDFMRQSNGGEGFVGPVSYLMLWRAEEIPERNTRLEVSKRAPSLLLFGSNGGDAAYAFNLALGSGARAQIVEIPYIDLGEREAARPRGSSFVEFLRNLAAET